MPQISLRICGIFLFGGVVELGYFARRERSIEREGSAGFLIHEHRVYEERLYWETVTLLLLVLKFSAPPIFPTTGEVVVDIEIKLLLLPLPKKSRVMPVVQRPVERVT